MEQGLEVHGLLGERGASALELHRFGRAGDGPEIRGDRLEAGLAAPPQPLQVGGGELEARADLPQGDEGPLVEAGRGLAREPREVRAEAPGETIHRIVRGAPAEVLAEELD